MKNDHVHKTGRETDEGFAGPGAALGTTELYSIGQLSPTRSDRKFLSLNETPSKLHLPAGMTEKLGQALQTKLAYEWKNIYRNLANMDLDCTDLVELKDFDQVCQKFKVNCTKEELKKIQRLCGDRPNHTQSTSYVVNPITHQPIETVNQTILDSEVINYRRLSYQLGLHKDSLNYMSRQL